MPFSTEHFWCPTHGRIDIRHGQTTVYDEKGGGPYIPYYKAYCRMCGEEGHFVCDGNTNSCRMATLPPRPGAHCNCLTDRCRCGEIPPQHRWVPLDTTQAEVCLFHRCHTHGHPFPGGVGPVTARIEQLDEALRNPFSDVGMSMEPQ